MAAILLFGKDDVIRSAVPPHYKTDCIKRMVNQERYDDRYIVATNLFDSYACIMKFVDKHLLDPFYLDGTKRMSLRDKIFREIVLNMLIHREYMNGSHAKLIIEPGEIIISNANLPHGYGQLDL